VSLDAPRPLAALVLVAIAGTTLSMTGQLEPWAMAIQAASLLIAFALRERPLAVQRSALALNLGLGCVVGGSLWVAARGAGSLVALAHFATLAQGLQLLDARPRRSEFLLVALALFQVILASNLTDSVLFPPLLALFLPTTVWTLLVHTIRTEALESGDPAAAQRALSPGLLRVTVFASACSVALALGLFLLLPRLHAGIVRPQLLGALGATAGFSERVELGDLGRIRSDPSVVLRVETVAGPAAAPDERYWRGLAFDVFDGRAWSLSDSRRTPIAIDPELGVDVAGGVESNVVQRILREPVSGGIVFVEGRPSRLEGPLGRLEVDAGGGVHAPSRSDERVRYTAESRVSPRDDAALRADFARPPKRGAATLVLPPLASDLSALAREAVGDAASDAERAAALESWLRRTGRYTDTPPAADPDDPRTPVERFLLGERAGHCEYFASAMVVLARSLGLPARLVNGFAGGRENEIGGFVELTRSDAHAWVEIHYEHAGWVRYDPTPPDLRLRAAVGASLGARLADLRSALELWWFQHVVEFDRGDQLRALRGAWLAWRGWKREREERARAPVPASSAWSLDLSASSLPLLGVAGAAFAVALVLARRRRARSRDRVPAAYAAALRLLARRGLDRPPAATARDFARHAATRLPAPAAESFDALTERYLAERFGGHADAERSAGLLRALRDSLRA
jgi:transglutaminase-like putative cysteine protease